MILKSLKPCFSCLQSSSVSKIFASRKEKCLCLRCLKGNRVLKMLTKTWTLCTSLHFREPVASGRSGTTLPAHSTQRECDPYAQMKARLLYVFKRQEGPCLSLSFARRTSGFLWLGALIAAAFSEVALLQNLGSWALEKNAEPYSFSNWPICPS